MIKIDTEKMTFKLEGTIPRLLVELEYAIADLFTQMVVSEDMDKETAEKLINESKDFGIDKATRTISEVWRRHEK